MRLRVDGRVSTHTCLSLAPKRGTSVGSSLSDAVQWNTPRGAIAFRIFTSYLLSSSTMFAIRMIDIGYISYRKVSLTLSRIACSSRTNL